MLRRRSTTTTTVLDSLGRLNNTMLLSLPLRDLLETLSYLSFFLINYINAASILVVSDTRNNDYINESPDSNNLGNVTLQLNGPDSPPKKDFGRPFAMSDLMAQSPFQTSPSDWAVKNGLASSSKQQQHQNDDICRCGKQEMCAGKKPDFMRPNNYSALNKYLDSQQQQQQVGGNVSSPDGKFFVPAEITIAFLIHIRYPQIVGAMALAVDAVNADEDVLPKTELKFKFERLTRMYTYLLKVR